MIFRKVGLIYHMLRTTHHVKSINLTDSLPGYQSLITDITITDFDPTFKPL